eukprot:6190542-Pleurochrysis_carterae.AAC.3
MDDSRQPRRSAARRTHGPEVASTQQREHEAESGHTRHSSLTAALHKRRKLRPLYASNQLLRRGILHSSPACLLGSVRSSTYKTSLKLSKAQLLWCKKGDGLALSQAALFAETAQATGTLRAVLPYCTMLTI